MILVLKAILIFVEGVTINFRNINYVKISIKELSFDLIKRVVFWR